MPVPPALPTEHIFLGRPYTPPAAWHQVNSPCLCGCPPCDRWTIFVSPAELDADYNGDCISGSNIPVIMPLTSTVTEPWCVTIRTVAGSNDVYVFERMFEGDVPGFYIDGVRYDYVVVSAGEVVCVCFQDGNWVVTGGGHGVNGGQN
jgi:hypothetical protein